MNERIKKLREIRGMNQEDFGAKLGLSRNYISLVENKQRNLSEPSVKLLCSLYDVNEDWLRYGTGEMYKIKDDSFSRMLSNLEDSDDDFIKSLIKAYMELDEDSKEALRKIAKKMSEKYEKPV